MFFTLILPIIFIFFLLLILSMVWPPNSPWAPWWRTSEKKARAVCRLAKIKKRDTIYELGSGEGNVLAVAASQYGTKGVGIEIDFFRAFLSRLILRWYYKTDKVKIITGDLFEQNISKANVVFVYLIPKTLRRLEDKFIQELKPGTRIVSLIYPLQFPLASENKKEKLFLYKVPQPRNNGKD